MSVPCSSYYIKNNNNTFHYAATCIWAGQSVLHYECHTLYSHPSTMVVDLFDLVTKRLPSLLLSPSCFFDNPIDSLASTAEWVLLWISLDHKAWLCRRLAKLTAEVSYFPPCIKWTLRFSIKCYRHSLYPPLCSRQEGQKFLRCYTSCYFGTCVELKRNL